MQTFKCDSCGTRLFFENVTCLACGREVGFDAGALAMHTVDGAGTASGRLEKCTNWVEHAACNWFRDPEQPYCLSCSLNEIVPDLASAQQRELWIETERAKRRLVFTLRRLNLPLAAPPGKQALRFRLLADERAETGAVDASGEAVLTGHDSGCLTVNVVEADGAIRETLRKRLGERYRTMLGHLRHEIGHYYWYALVEGTSAIKRFRALFGDERASYEQALERHYAEPPAEGWQSSFVSAYATMHPWEDFAETWAHYIHIVDTLETAADGRVAVDGVVVGEPLPLDRSNIGDVLADWFRLTVALNQLNRSMGLNDAYPFALTDAVIDKLRFIDDLCRAAGHAAEVPQGVIITQRGR